MLRYFAEFDSFRGQLRKSGWLAVDCLPINIIKYTNKHDGRAVLFAIAELLVHFTKVSYTLMTESLYSDEYSFACKKIQ